MSLIGRLSPGATVDQSRAEFSSFLGSEQAQLPSVLRGTTGSAEPIDDYLLEGIRPLVWTLVAAVGLLTVIAIVNVGALFAGHGVARGQEFAVRRSLGATAGRIIRQLITESMVLAGACTIAGIALAHALVWLLTALAPSELRADVILVDWRAVLVASTIAVGAAIGLGLVAAFVPLRLDLTTPLRSALRRDPAGGRRVERTLVVIQIALALVVLGGAGLLVRSLANLRQLDWGVSANEVLIAQLVPSDPRESQDVADYNRRLDDLMTAVAAIPGVVSAAPILMAPFGGTAGWDARFLVEGQPEDQQSRQPLLNFEIATPEYFRTMGVQLIRGRVFSQDDRVEAPPVIVVSESVARMAWPDADPIGRRMKISGSPWATVIGVAADTRYRQLTRLRPTVYRPRAQVPTAPRFSRSGPLAI